MQCMSSSESGLCIGITLEKTGLMKVLKILVYHDKAEEDYNMADLLSTALPVSCMFKLFNYIWLKTRKTALASPVLIMFLKGIL